MSWRTYAVDTISGRILCPIDLPNFTWSVSVSDSSLSTTKSKGAGRDEVSGLKVPWTAVPANSPDERSRLLAPDRRSIALCWTSPLDDEDAIGTPILCGPIGQLTPKISPGYGFAAIIVAFVGRLKPLGTIPAAFIMALFYLGGELAQSRLGTPAALTGVFQGLLLFSIMACDSLIFCKLKWVGFNSAKGAA